MQAKFDAALKAQVSSIPGANAASTATGSSKSTAELAVLLVTAMEAEGGHAPETTGLLKTLAVKMEAQQLALQQQAQQQPHSSSNCFLLLLWLVLFPVKMLPHMGM